MKPDHNETGVGATQDLHLRASIATLVRVLFEHPADGKWMLALERKATVQKSENGPMVTVKSQPFGGAIRIQDLSRIRVLTGDFHFDSERSRSEQDFRIFIRPSDWPVVRDFCVEQFERADGLLLETDPTRELAEEFTEALNIDLRPDQYIYQPVATVIEDHPAPAENVQARGYRTVRVYRIFEAHLLDSLLTDVMMTNSQNLSDQRLYEIALEDLRQGGKGRANAILALPLQDLTQAYLAIPPNERNTPILFAAHRLDETIAAVLEGIIVPKYRRV